MSYKFSFPGNSSLPEFVNNVLIPRHRPLIALFRQLDEAFYALFEITGVMIFLNFRVVKIENSPLLSDG